MVLTAAGFVVFRFFGNKIEYLFLKTSYGEKHWTPPKGHVDPGETEAETAARETLEESGLAKEDLKVYEHSKRILQYVVKSKPKIVVYWLAELINPNAEIKLSSEHTEFKWLDMENLRTYAKYDDMINLIEDYNNFIKLNKL
ncbi:diadenosine 55-p1p4-tetraphosphate pyrophosphohydrolase mutt [Holotrichia oblita]|uniref:Diadenosine 55-p1p4-tetraphosphate pyrophosphohydrolase mutt n=1 Tax=Holotrichia oblita TaxID=644536 RepID=A0ACB9TS04_HOLOL|nr:diadenosine 55-p1p4-tetraphosphate pyrophosphohydrolase mutt [Holotrichia oblita]